jgi:hypothetical protein
MIPTSSTLNAAAAAFERAIATEVSLDNTVAGLNPDLLDVTRLVSHWNVNRTSTTDLPDAAKLAQGYVSAELTGTLIGSVTPDVGIVDGARTWSPYSGSSVLGGVGQGITNPIRVRAGMVTTAGIELHPRFTGYLRDLDISGEDRTAAFSALDGNSRLRNPVVLPVMGNSYLTSATSPRVGIRPNLYATTIMDFALRQNGYYMSPPPALNCILSIPAHGSLYAEPGYGAMNLRSPCIEEPTSTGTETDDGSMITYAPSGAFAGGPMGDNGLSGVLPALVPICTGTSGSKKDIKALYDPLPVTFANVWANGKTITVEAWVYCSTTPPQGYAGTQPAWGMRFSQPPSVPTPATYHLASVGVLANGTPYVSIGSGFTVATGTAPVSTGWLYVRINLAFGASSTTVKAHINNEAVQTFTCAAVPSTGGAGTSATFKAQLCTNRTDQSTATSTGVIVPFEGVQVTTNAEGAPLNWGYVPNAYLDQSLSPLVVSPHADTDRDAKQLITDLTTAEYGMSQFDELGNFYFFNRQRWTRPPGNASQLTVVSTNALETLHVVETQDSVFNQISTSYTPYGIKTHGVVYALSKLIGVHSGATFSYLADLGVPVLGMDTGTAGSVLVDGTLPPLPAGPVGNSGYRVSWWPDGRKPTGSGLSDPPNNVAVNLNIIDDDTVKITIINSESNPIYLVSGYDQAASSRGQPFLYLFGRAVSINDTSTGDNSGQSTVYYVEDSTSIHQYGDQPLTLSDGDAWCQSLAVATTVGNDMLAYLKDLHPVLTNVQIKGHPGLQMGDRITLTDTDATQFNSTGIVVGFPSEDWDVQENGEGLGYTQQLDIKLGV